MASFVAPSSVRKDRLVPGTYTATATSVDFDEDYVDDTMLIVKYDLVDSSGRMYSFLERFENREGNKRTEDLDCYLKENAVSEGISGIAGHSETVVLKKVRVAGRSYLNIVERTFIK